MAASNNLFRHLGLLCLSMSLFTACSKPSQNSVAQQIPQVVQAQAQSKSYDEWQRSGATPDAIFDHLAQVAPANRAGEAAQVCLALDKLSAQDLATFEHELHEHPVAWTLPCQNELQEKLAKYWAEQKRHLDQVHPLVQSPTALPTAVRELPLHLPNDLYVRAGLGTKEVAFTFDDGPDASSDHTMRLLAILQQFGVHSNFFEIGQNASRHPELSQATVAKGHIVGSHTWNHPSLPTLTEAAAERQILDGRSAVVSASGFDIPFFRFPYGAFNTALRQFIYGQGLSNFFWKYDSEDWKTQTADHLLQKVLADFDNDSNPGGIILMHEIQERTILALPHIFEELRTRGYTIVLFVPQGMRVPVPQRVAAP